jgi:hypothetical protein
MIQLFVKSVFLHVRGCNFWSCWQYQWFGGVIMDSRMVFANMLISWSVRLWQCWGLWKEFQMSSGFLIPLRPFMCYWCTRGPLIFLCTWTDVFSFVLKLCAANFCLLEWFYRACCHCSTWTLLNTTLQEVISSIITRFTRPWVKRFDGSIKSVVCLTFIHLGVNFLIIWVRCCSLLQLFIRLLFAFLILLLVAWASTFAFYRFIFASNCLFSHCLNNFIFKWITAFFFGF